MEARTAGTRFTPTVGTCQGGEAYRRERGRDRGGLELNGRLLQSRPLAGLKQNKKAPRCFSGALNFTAYSRISDILVHDFISAVADAVIPSRIECPCHGIERVVAFLDVQVLVVVGNGDE